MPVSLRRRLYCHFCGKKSAQTHFRTFTCEHCEAVNHLDKNGEITDPPIATIIAPTQYAKPRPFEVNNVFCRTCVKNQDIVTRLLADFVPDEGDPGHMSALQGLPAYRHRLNQDYPQCCAECEPRARSRMTAATKAAASDNMRRQIQRSKTKKPASIIDWRVMLVEIARFGYFSSIVIQLLWHLFGAQGGSTTEYRGPMHCFSEWPAPVTCQDTAIKLLPYSIIVGFLCMWWNPGWHRKLKSREGRLVGLGKFYAMQIVIMAFRVGVAKLLTDITLSEQQCTVAHGVSLIVLTVLTGFGLCLVALDATPLINWGYEAPRLVSTSQFVPPAAQVEQSFPLNQLAPVPQQNLQPWRPPTPPAEDEDAMDWTPSQSFQPKRHQLREVGPSPFHGRLPALPGGMRRPEPKQSIGLPPGFFDNRETLPQRRTEANTATMAEPRFFPTSVDTGLEKMFGQVFSLGDEEGRQPVRSEADQFRKAQGDVFDGAYQDSPGATKATHSADVVPLFSSIFTLLLLSLWLVSTRLSIALPHLRQTILICSCLAPSISIFHTGPTSSPLDVAEIVGTCVLVASSHTLPDDTLHSLGLLVLVQSLLRGIYAISHSKAGHNIPARPPEVVIMEDQPHRPAANFSPPSNPAFGHGQPRRKSSANTVLSEASIVTTSTNPDWKTPRASRSSAFMDPSQSLSMDGLGLDSGPSSRRGRRDDGF